MLRNLVTSLIEHEQIKTTLPKARDTARLAEKIISLGKEGTLTSFRRATEFLLKPSVTPKLFDTIAKRYADRAGGYTRVHKYGNRPGDNAPVAIVELVDSPRDIKFEMTAKAVGWEILSKRLEKTNPQMLVNHGVEGVREVIESESKLGPTEKGELREKTRWNVQKVLRFRGEEGVTELEQKAKDHIDTLLAKPLAMKQVAPESQEENPDAPLASLKYLKLKAGQTMPGGVMSTLRIAQGALGKEPPAKPRWFERRKLGLDRTDVWTRL